MKISRHTFKNQKFAHTARTVLSLRQCNKNVSGVDMREKTADSNSEDAILLYHKKTTCLCELHLSTMSISFHYVLRGKMFIFTRQYGWFVTYDR